MWAPARGVPRAGETPWLPLGDTGEWRVTPTGCVSAYYREIARDARGWCVAVRFCDHQTQGVTVKPCVTRRGCVRLCCGMRDDMQVTAWDPVRLGVPETLFGELVVTSRDYVRARDCVAQCATGGGHERCACHTGRRCVTEGETG